MTIAQVHVGESEVWAKGQLWVSRGACGSSSGEVRTGGLRKRALLSEAQHAGDGGPVWEGLASPRWQRGLFLSFSDQPSLTRLCRTPTLSSNSSSGKGPWESCSALLTPIGRGPRHPHPSPTCFYCPFCYAGVAAEPPGWLRCLSPGR